MLAGVGFMQAFGYSSFKLKGCEDKVTTLVETAVTNHLRGIVNSQGSPFERCDFY
jgi:hypothetical protein